MYVCMYVCVCVCVCVCVLGNNRYTVCVYDFSQRPSTVDPNVGRAGASSAALQQRSVYYRPEEHVLIRDRHGNAMGFTNANALTFVV